MSLQLTRVNRFADTRRVAGAVRRFVLKQPGSVAISILLVVVSVTTSLLAPPHARQGYPGSLPRPSTATENSSVTFLVAHHPIELFLGLAATLLLVGVSERRIGLKRTLLAYAVTALVALGSAAVIQFTVMALFGNQTQLSYRVATVPLYAPAVGTILTASAFAGPLWRRRIRVLGFAATATFVLFEGSFSGVSTLIAAAAGLALGVLLRSGRRIARPTWARSSHHEARVLVSTLVAISALGPFLTAVSPTPVGPLVSLGALFRDSFPRQALSRACQVSSATHGNDFVLNPYGDCTRSLALGGLHTPGTIAVGLLPLLVLLIAAFFIRRGRRLAVVVAIAINVVLGLSSAASVLVAQSGTGPNDRLIALHVLLSLVSALIPWGIATMLLLLLPHFAIPTSPAHGRRLVVWIGSAAVLLVGGYTVVGALEPAMFVPSVSPLGLLVSGFEHLLPVGFIGIDHIGSVPTGGLARVLFENIGWIFWTLVAVAVLSAMRVPPGRDRRDASAAIRVLLERGSAGNLSYMSTWQGNSIWFAGDRSTAVAYRLVGDIAITIGEPIGAPEHSVRTIEAFAQWCDDQSYVPVFYSVRAELSPAFRAMSWYELPVGEETVLRPRTFSMQGK
ncbi:MAG: Phosphatidylglycerol lysyltransferase, partial [Frondihabitans sp.]|nr:Phosphatidylglycerol lysyltransferase [Frondihabitans sp.]